jgi:hypothetical protein
MFPHRTRFNNFLHVGRWDPEKSLRKKALEILSRLSPKEGDTMYLILDDSKKYKQGTKINAAGRLFDHITFTPKLHGLAEKEDFILFPP